MLSKDVREVLTWLQKHQHIYIVVANKNWWCCYILQVYFVTEFFAYTLSYFKIYQLKQILNYKCEKLIYLQKLPAIASQYKTLNKGAQ